MSSYSTGQSAPTGPAGGQLTGTYPNPTLNPPITNTGETGAAVQTRWIGGTSGGAPIAGTWQAGDIAVDVTGTIWLCTVGGTPGTWVDVSGIPSGPAGGDLAGTYPNPTLALIGGGAIGPIGDGTHVPVVTRDAKGRVTGLTSTAITGAAPTGAAGGDLAGNYPNPTLAVIGAATGPIGDATHVPVVTIDAKGRVTALTSAAISSGGLPQTGIRLATAATLLVSSGVTGDTNDRWSVTADGTHKWGPGNAATDTTLARTAVGTLTLSTILAAPFIIDTANTGPFIATGAAQLTIDGRTAGNTIKIGNATTTKVGFYGAAGASQHAAIGNPAGGAVVDSQSRTAIAGILQAIGTTFPGVGITAD